MPLHNAPVLPAGGNPGPQWALGSLEAGSRNTASIYHRSMLGLKQRFVGFPSTNGGISSSKVENPAHFDDWRVESNLQKPLLLLPSISLNNKEGGTRSPTTIQSCGAFDDEVARKGRRRSRHRFEQHQDETWGRRPEADRPEAPVARIRDRRTYPPAPQAGVTNWLLQKFTRHRTKQEEMQDEGASRGTPDETLARPETDPMNCKGVDAAKVVAARATPTALVERKAVDRQEVETKAVRNQTLLGPLKGAEAAPPPLPVPKVGQDAGPAGPDGSVVQANSGATAWGLFRNQLLNAKVTDAFNNVRFALGGKRFSVLRKIGEGGYSKVYEVFDDQKQLYALKVVGGLCHPKSAKVPDPSSEMKEVLLMEEFRELSADRVVLMMDYDVCEDLARLGAGAAAGAPIGGRQPPAAAPHSSTTQRGGDAPQERVLYILMERGEADLSGVVSNLRGRDRLTPAKVRYFWEEMLEALMQVHDARVIHSDIKPANFLLVRGIIKLIDFGFAAKLPESSDHVRRNFVAGTKDYLSPEALSCYVIEEGHLDLEKLKHSTVKLYLQSDIWAMGIILFQWAYDGLLPFASLPGGRLTRIKATADADLPVPLEPLEDSDLFDTLRLCLQKDPLKRPLASELLRHPYLRGSSAPLANRT